MDKSTLPLKIAIASPCPARWEDMGGDQKVRFCDHCRKNVYDLSAMTSAEANSMLHAKNGQLCARIFQRADGTVLTEDCPAGIARHWRRVKTAIASGVAVMLLALANFAAFGRGNEDSAPRSKGRVLTAIDDVTYKVKARLGLNPPVMVMGMVAPRVTITNSPTPPLMGKVSVHPPTNSPVKK